MKALMRGIRGRPGRVGLIGVLVSALATSGSPATRLFTVPPCRVLDTRGASPLLANTSRTVPVTGGCAVPSSAASVVANLTIVGPSAAGALVIYPAGSSVPGTSTLNFRAGATRANNAQVLLSSGGSAEFLLAAANGSSANLLVDVVGYFSTNASAFDIGGATVSQHLNNTGPATGTLTTKAVSTATGSLLLCSIARGVWANAPSTPSDNQANAYSLLGTTHRYADYPGAQSALYHKVNATGSAAHTFSMVWGAAAGGPGAGGDEVTIAAIEVKGATSVNATTFVERAAAPTLSGLPTSTTGPGLFVSFCWGTGPVRRTHDFRPGPGWTRIDSATAAGDPSPNGYIQVAVAYRIVTGATTDTVAWSNAATSEGAQIYTIALQ